MRYQLQVQLREISPPIWRTLEAPGALTLHRLHEVLQVVMGWLDEHLYLFEVEGKLYGEPSPEWEIPVADSTTTTLEQVAAIASSFTYEYDLGDRWLHDITLEEAHVEREDEEPLCTGGARACPPEDCGGPPGYEEFLEAITDPEHEEHDETLEWVGGEFDPEAFDLDEVNLLLRLPPVGDEDSL